LLGCAVLVLVSTTGGLPATAQGRAQEPDRIERHRVPADFMSFRGAQWLERDERVQEEQPGAVLDAMGLEVGDVVADMGCGSGYYARRMAQRVAPEGRVYCVDIQPEMLDMMQQLAERDGVTGIVPVLGDVDDPKLPAGEVDWIILADVYHEMSEYEAMLAAMRAALAPGGRVALLEYRIEDGTGDNLKSDHAMSVRQVLAEWLPAGFALAELHEFLPGQHLFVMKVAGDTEVPGDPIINLDLFEAVEQGLVEAEAVGAGNASVTVRIRNTGDDKLLVTMPVGVSFQAADGGRDMVSRRDAAIRLFDGVWRDWAVRSVGRQQGPPAAGTGDRFTIERPANGLALNNLMYAMQVGTYRVADSPLLYIPRVHGVEQAAVWIAEANPSYDDLASAVEDDRMPAQYAVAFALIYCDLAGIDVTRTRVWEDREQVFGLLRDPGLTAWYQIKTTGQIQQ
jgi:predicted methyltransferase|tara:strand:- start:2871 stop:4229 length:1359 start_codon:yes stop_codon:yes gene_type:complete